MTQLLHRLQRRVDFVLPSVLLVRIFRPADPVVGAVFQLARLHVHPIPEKRGDGAQAIDHVKCVQVGCAGSAGFVQVREREQLGVLVLVGDDTGVGLDPMLVDDKPVSRAQVDVGKLPFAAADKAVD